MSSGLLAKEFRQLVDTNRWNYNSISADNLYKRQEPFEFSIVGRQITVSKTSTGKFLGIADESIDKVKNLT